MKKEHVGSEMRTIVSYPGSGLFAQQVGRAFLEHDALQAFVTTFCYHPDSFFARAVASIPGSLPRKFRAGLERRAITLIPRNFVHTDPILEILRTAASRLYGDPIVEDRIWDRMSHSFDAMVANKYVKDAEAVYAYEYTARATFRRARAEGVATVLDLPSLNNRAFNRILKAEKEKFGELEKPVDAYFAHKFEKRQARREEEIELADVIVVNSNLTMRSHVEGGADPEKIVVVPLACPPPLAESSCDYRKAGPLRVIWAGNFTIGKGAHYFLEAWRQLNPHGGAEAVVYGTINLPEQALRSLPSGITFRGHVERERLLSAFEKADVLAFPTLSDGFGMVAAEALSRGLPVITTNQAGAADLICHGKNGLIVPAANSHALRDALRWCLDNRQKLYEMRVAALATASQRQWIDYRKNLIKSLNAALAKSGFSSLLTTTAQPTFAE